MLSKVLALVLTSELTDEDGVRESGRKRFPHRDKIMD